MTQAAQAQQAQQPGPTAVKKQSAATEAVTIQLPKHVHDWFKQKADADERTIAKYIARLLRDHHADATAPAKSTEEF